MDREDRFEMRRRDVYRAARRSTPDGRLAALLVTSPVDIRYLCGVTEGAAGLLIGRGWATVYTGRMFQVRVQREAVGVEITVLSATSLFSAVRRRVGRLTHQVLGFEEEVLSVARHRVLTGACDGVDLVGVGAVVKERRSVKDAAEIAVIRRAVAFAETAFRGLIGGGVHGLVGRTERDVAAELDYRMRQEGADRQAFQSGTIVAAGPNAYNCHHRPGDRVIERGDVLLLDWGAEVDGYRSDITRTLFMGWAADGLDEIYDIVLEAHDAAVEAMGSRVRCHTVDAAARGVIDRAGYGAEFRHGLGHGIGLEVHEGPSFGRKPVDGPGTALKPGMVVTVEPGIYLEGVGGVRIEDDILVTDRGCERLNSLPRDRASMTLT